MLRTYRLALSLRDCLRARLGRLLRSPRRARRASAGTSRGRSPVALELLVLEQRNPPSSLLDFASRPGTAADAGDSLALARQQRSLATWSYRLRDSAPEASAGGVTGLSVASLAQPAPLPLSVAPPVSVSTAPAGGFSPLPLPGQPQPLLVGALQLPDDPLAAGPARPAPAPAPKPPDDRPVGAGAAGGGSGLLLGGTAALQVTATIPASPATTAPAGAGNSALMSLLVASLAPGSAAASPSSPAPQGPVVAWSPDHTTPAPATPAADAGQPATAPVSAPPGGSGPGSSKPHGKHDPLYVLDANTGVTLPPNTPLNTFSTWSEDLRAQASGATAMSYLWDLGQAPDAQNVSRTDTYDLTFTWKTFTGTAHTDTITLTETNNGNPSTLTQTLTFIVAGTDSSTRPTTASTWPTVLTPDALTSGQETADAAPYASLGLAAGDVQTEHDLPAYNPNVDALSLVYDSAAADLLPTFLVHYQLDPTQPTVPTTVTAQLTLNGTAGSIIYYNTSTLNSTLNPGDIMQIALQGNATALATGRYNWQISVTANYGTPVTSNYSGQVDVVNGSTSANNLTANPFGPGWSLADVERLCPVSGGVILQNPDGTSLWFANGSQSGTFVTPPGDFSTLVQNTTTGVYTRTLTDGTQINFDSSGKQTSIVDRNSNTTTFAYNASKELTAITDLNGQAVQLAYNASGQVTGLTDPASRATTLAYSGAQLTAVADPDSALWRYAYSAANQLTGLTDPNTHTTTFTYSQGQVTQVTRADNSTEGLIPVQGQGLPAPGTGTQGNPATAVLAAAAAAQYTDPRSNTWATGLDWLGFGLAVSQADPLGDTALTYRDAVAVPGRDDGLPWLAADPVGGRLRSFFDSNGNPTLIAQQDDTTRRYSYNSFSEPTQFTNEEGNVTTYTYDSKGNLTKLTQPDPDGGGPLTSPITSYAYNSKGLVTRITDPNNHTTTYSYDTPLNRLTGVTDALNHTATYAFNSASDMTSSTDRRGFTSTYAYDAMGRRTGATLPDSATVFSTYAFAFDAAGNQTGVTDPLNHTTTSRFDALNRRTAVTDALNHTTTYTLDGNGNRIAVTNALGNTTTYGYDQANRLTSITLPATGNGPLAAGSVVWNYRYDAAGQRTSVTDPLNETTNYAYTPRGQLSRVNYPAVGQQTSGEEVDIDWCPCGCCPETITYVPGQATVLEDPQTYTYKDDNLHRTTQVTDPLNNNTFIAWDSESNRTKVTDPRGQATNFSYNALNEQTAVTDPLAHTTSYALDAEGNTTSVTDANGNTTTFALDAQGRVTAVTRGGGTTSYAYNLAGLLTALTDPVGNTTGDSYDAANRLTKVTVASTPNPTTYGYDAANELTSIIDRDGRKRTFAYDTQGHQTGETWLNSLNQVIYQETLTYNTVGQLTGASDPYSVYSYAYNSDGKLTSVNNAGTPGVPQVTLTYGYDDWSRETSLADSLGGSISYTLDSDGRLTGAALSLSGSVKAQATLGYDTASRLTGVTRKLGSGGDTLTSSLNYDNADRLTGITHTDATRSLTLSSFAYGYDVGNRVTSYTGPEGSLTFGYDTTDQLTGVTGTVNGNSYSESYSYDLNGNRQTASFPVDGVQQNFTYTVPPNSGNEVQSDGVYNYTYDNEGNLLTQTRIGDGQLTSFSWDYRNRLTEVTVKDGQGNLLHDEKFTYDVNNNRIGVWLDGTQVSWTVYDRQNPYLDFTGAGAVSERYLSNPQALDQLFARVDGSGTNVGWYLTDRLGSVRQVVNGSNGTVLDQ